MKKIKQLTVLSLLLVGLVSGLSFYMTSGSEINPFHGNSVIED